MKKIDSNNLICEIKQKRIFVLIQCLGCFLFVLIGITFCWFADYFSGVCTPGSRACFGNPLAYMILGVVLLIFFGVSCFPFSVRALISPKIIFAATKESFYCANNYSKTGFWVKWDEIKELELLTVSKTQFIGFSLKNKYRVDKILSHYSFFAKYLLSANKSLSGFDFTLSFTGTGTDLKQIYNLMMQKCEENFEKTD